MDGSLNRGVEESQVSMSHGRKMACMEAAWEVEALALLLMQLDMEDGLLGPLQLRGVAVRIAQLAGVVMAGLDDEVVQERDLRRKLFFLVKETQNG